MVVKLKARGKEKYDRFESDVILNGGQASHDLSLLFFMFESDVILNTGHPMGYM